MLWFRRHVLRRRMSADGRSERGATAVEYGLIVALFAMGMFGVVTALRASLSTGSVTAENRVGSPQSQVAAPTNASFSAPSCSAGQVIGAGGTCTSGITYCPSIGRGYDSVSNSCAVCGGGSVLATGGTCQPGVTACPAMGKWFNAATSVCDTSYAGTCVGSQTYNSSTNRCIQPTCSGSQWLDANAGLCLAKAVCVGSQLWNSANNQCVEPTCQPPNVLNPATHTCVAGVAYCSSRVPVRWYNATEVTCDVIPMCSNPASPYDSSTNTCKATAANCAASLPARYYNSTAGTCDVIPTCSDPGLPYDSTTNTCKATTANCAAASPARYLTGGRCELVTAATQPGKPSGSPPSGNTGRTRVNLTWTAPSSDGGAAITDYIIQYSTSASGPWTTFSHTASTSTSVTVTGLSRNTTYYFRVAAVNSAGTSSYSSVSSSITTNN